MSSKPFWYLRAIRSSIRSHGLWSGIRLTFLLLQHAVETWVGTHRKPLGYLGMAALVAGALGFAYSEILKEPIESAAQLAQWSIALSLAFAAFLVGTAHFVLRRQNRPQVIYRALNGVIFSLIVAVCGYLGFDRWNALYHADPASATLWGLIAVATLFAFFETITWFVRSAMFRSLTAGEANDLLAMSDRGRWRAAVHEAGHALTYALSDAIRLATSLR